MKKAVNFRLGNQIMHILSVLEAQLNISKTAIVENALQAYAKRILQNNHPLLKHVGSLAEKDAESMLKIIKSNKHNKELKVNL